MNRSTMASVVVGMLTGLAAMMGCSGSEDPSGATPQGQAGQGNPGTPQLIECGSGTLFSQTHDACGAMDAVGGPDENGADCRCLIGYAWDGSACVGLGGCACKGADCDKLTQTEEACLALHAACGSAPQPALHCGSTELFSLEHQICGAMNAKAAPDENGMSCDCFLGFAWNGAECVGLGDCRCVGSDCDKLTQDKQACETLHTGCGLPEPAPVECGSSTLFSQTHSQCAAMDATASPDGNGNSCYCFLGFAWNGSSCTQLADCQCVGADCDKLTQTQDECLQAHAACP